MGRIWWFDVVIPDCNAVCVKTVQRSELWCLYLCDKSVTDRDWNLWQTEVLLLVWHGEHYIVPPRCMLICKPLQPDIFHTSPSLIPMTWPMWQDNDAARAKGIWDSAVFSVFLCCVYNYTFSLTHPMSLHTWINKFDTYIIRKYHFSSFKIQHYIIMLASKFKKWNTALPLRFLVKTIFVPNVLGLCAPW